ncbi:hypothetical protein GCM10028807_17360 [Spirosoma daeguense]
MPTPKTPAQLKALLRSNIKLSPPAPPRSNSAEVILVTLEEFIDSLSLGTWAPIVGIKADGQRYVWQVIDWQNGIGTKPTTGQYIGANGYVATAAEAMDVRGQQGIQGIQGNQGPQGLPGNGIVRTTTLTTDGLAATRYYPICFVGQDDGFARVELTIKPLESGDHAPITVSAYFACRGGFVYEYISSGPTNLSMGLQCYSNGGNITVVAKVLNTFKTVSARVVDYGGPATVVHSTLIGQNAAPAGSLVFDSNVHATYKPMRYHSLAHQTLAVGNSDGAYPPFTNQGGFASLFLAANLVGGNTDIALMNTNQSAGDAGISLFQQLSANTKRMLAYFRGNGRVQFGEATSTERLTLEGRLATQGVYSFGTLPTISKGNACNAATLETNSNDMAGIINIATTSGHTAGAVICTVNFTSALPRTPKVFIQPMNAHAVNNYAKMFVATGVNSFTVMNTSTALDNSQTIQFAYLVII